MCGQIVTGENGKWSGTKCKKIEGKLKQIASAAFGASQ